MDKRASAARVNTSYSIFFLIATIGVTYVLSSSFRSDAAWFVILGYALLIYFVWDFIMQLYSPGQSLIIYCLVFWIIPALLALTIGNKFPIAGFLIWLLATPIAGLVELIYESVFKSIAPKHIMRRLLLADSKIDRSLVRLNMKHESNFNFRSLLFVLLLTVIYCSVSVWLIWKL